MNRRINLHGGLELLNYLDDSVMYNISVEIHRDRFKNIKGDPSSVWNGIMLRVLGKEGKVKGILSRSQNKLADAVIRLLGREETEEES